jgi:hypothetical protein
MKLNEESSSEPTIFTNIAMTMLLVVVKVYSKQHCVEKGCKRALLRRNVRSLHNNFHSADVS